LATLTDVFVSLAARALLTAMPDRDVDVRLGLTTVEGLTAPAIDGAHRRSLGDLALARRAARDEAWTTPTGTTDVDRFNAMVITAGRGGPRVLMPPLLNGVGICIGFGEVAPQVVPIGDGIGVRHMVTVSIRASADAVHPTHLRQLAEDLRERIDRA
jgi:hypothetical protein